MGGFFCRPPPPPSSYSTQKVEEKLELGQWVASGFSNKKEEDEKVWHFLIPSPATRIAQRLNFHTQREEKEEEKEFEG